MAVLVPLLVPTLGWELQWLRLLPLLLLAQDQQALSFLLLLELVVYFLLEPGVVPIVLVSQPKKAAAQGELALLQVHCAHAHDDPYEHENAPLQYHYHYDLTEFHVYVFRFIKYLVLAIH